MEYTFRTDPYDHQAEWLPKTWDKEAFAYWWEQRTGKSKMIIDTAAALYEHERINGVLILSPQGVHTNWIKTEFPTHYPERLNSKTRAMYWSTDRSRTKGHAKDFEKVLASPGIAILSMSYDGIMTEAGRNAAKRFLTKRKCLYTLDEAHRIKTPGAKRTKRVVASGVYAPYRRLLTGTPISKGPFDVYAPVRFLDKDFWKPRGLDSFFAFKTHFGVFTRGYNRKQGREYEELTGYQRLDELTAWLEPIISRVTQDVLNMPPKVYSKNRFELSSKQREAYDRLRDEYIVELDSGDKLDVPFAMVRLTRLQQITCGYLPTESDQEESQWVKFPENPRLEVLSELVEDMGHQGIIWARFRQDIDQICRRLTEMGHKFVRYDGTVKTDELRLQNRNAFNAGDVQWFVGNPAAAGEGVPLPAARVAIYYSNSFKLLERLQSEDRPLFKGMKKSLDVIDLLAMDTVDDNIVENLRAKVNIASQVTGDKLREWL